MSGLLSRMMFLSLSVVVLADLSDTRAQEIPPIVLQCTPRLVIPCNRSIDTAAIPINNTGGCGEVGLSYVDSIIPGSAPNRFTVTRTWTASDTCGQKQTCVQTIQIVPSKPRVAVLPLENLAESEDGARVFARLMQDQLVQSANLDVISAGEVETATLRARIRLPVLMDNDQTRRLRQVLDADYFVLGTILAYQSIADQYSGVVPVVGITLQLRDAVSGVTVWSETYHEIGNSGEWLFGLGVEHDITKLAHSIARRAVSRLQRIAKPLPCGQVVP